MCGPIIIYVTDIFTTLYEQVERTVNSLEPKPGQIKPRSYYLRLAITQRGLTVHADHFCQYLLLIQCA